MRMRLRFGAADRHRSPPDGPRARGAFLLRALMDPPLVGARPGRAPLSLLAGRVRRRAGQCPAIRVRHPRPAGRRATAAPGSLHLRRRPGDAAAGRDPPASAAPHPRPDPLQAMDLGVSPGAQPHGSTVMLVGAYQMRGEIEGERLLAALPRRHLHEDAVSTPVPALRRRDRQGRPGWRRCSTASSTSAHRRPGVFPAPRPRRLLKYRAHDDPVVGRAPRMMRQQPRPFWSSPAWRPRSASPCFRPGWSSSPTRSANRPWRTHRLAPRSGRRLCAAPVATVGAVRARSVTRARFALSSVSSA